MIELPLILNMVMFAADGPRQVTIEEFMQRQCQAGKQKACAQARQLAIDLEAAYPLVMRDYQRMEASAGHAQLLLEDYLPQCARHYHNHWINKRMWWPAREDGKPDWLSIYTFIVDHYYGFCVKQ